MEIAITSITNQEKGKIKLPAQFNEPVRPDLIKRAVLSIQSRKRQAYGSKPEAGQRQSAKLSRRRRDYKGSYGAGISRVPRKILSRRGTRMYWVAAVAPGTVGGRRAHPPKSGKVWEQKINKKENKKAIRSALSATIIKELVAQRGHEIPSNYPIIFDNSIEEIESTKKLQELLKGIGIQIPTERKIRVGKGKIRGRRYKGQRGMLIVVGKKCPVQNAARNLLGIEVCEVKNINAETLAPGGIAGRLTIYTNDAIDRIEKEKLFK
jgi:large subunit ribosomal protein L4e